ncbi:MAG: hypothetical protein ACTIJ6_00845 [Leucobacter sp.]
MEDFVKYLADIIEFLVGGVLIALAIVVSFALFFPDLVDPVMHTLFQIPDSIGLVVSLAGLALIYGLGVIIEGVSRAVVEWRLDRVTVECISAFRQPPQELQGAELTQWAVRTREVWRAAAEADESGKSAITTQLSRLRVERTFLLTSYIVMVALAIKSLVVSPAAVNGYGLATLVMIAFSIILFRLVNVRFGRFVNGIIREYHRLQPASADTPPTARRTWLRR